MNVHRIYIVHFVTNCVKPRRPNIWLFVYDSWIVVVWTVGCNWWHRVGYSTAH